MDSQTSYTRITEESLRIISGKNCSPSSRNNTPQHCPIILLQTLSNVSSEPSSQCSEDVVRQNPEDLDPDRYIDDGELTELPEIPLVELERVHMEPVAKTVNPEITLEVDQELGLQVPEEMEDMDGIHERI